MTETRLLQAEDLPRLIEPLKEQARFFGNEPQMPDADWLETLQRDGPGGAGLFDAIAVFDGDVIIGFLLFSRIYLVASAAKGAFVRDIFISEPFRRQGTGKALMKQLTQVCVDQDLRWIEWRLNRLDFDARTFFDMVFLESFKVDYLTYQLDQDQIASFAASPLAM